MEPRLDRRAAVFQVYKTARCVLPMRQAYDYAQRIVKPLPENREDRNLRAAYARIADPAWRSCNTDQYCNTPRQLWAQAYCDARYWQYGRGT